ncbi:hypothetical protein BV20DRAFT_905938, partial [Pilatotrama ljubarskyi]
LQYAKSPLICGIYDSGLLENALPQMSRLRTVSFAMPESAAIHGISWSVLKCVLSLPNVQNLSLDFMRFAPALSPGEHLRLGSSSSLTSFRYILSEYRSRSQAFPHEDSGLALVVRRNHGTLQRLSLPAHHAPLKEVFNIPVWPKLRDFRLQGESGDLTVPLISSLRKMSGLHTLELKLIQPDGVDPRPVWPPGHAITWPWPELRHLTICCPQVQDQVYDALPTTLETLSLRYAPHYADHVWEHAYGKVPDLPWQWPLLGSAEVTHILARCRLPLLRHLELEYRDDGGECDLLRHIAAALENLEYLKLYHYRQSNDA